MSFPGDKSHISVWCSVSPRLFSLREILFSLSKHKSAGSSLAASSIPSSPGCCCVLHNGKLQPETQMAQSKVTLSIDFCCVLFLHLRPNLWITAAKCIFVHGLYMSVLSCKLGMDDTGGRSGGQWHRDRSGAVCTCSSESFGCRLGNSVISQKWSYTFHVYPPHMGTEQWTSFTGHVLSVGQSLKK